MLQLFVIKNIISNYSIKSFMTKSQRNSTILFFLRGSPFALSSQHFTHIWILVQKTINRQVFLQSFVFSWFVPSKEEKAFVLQNRLLEKIVVASHFDRNNSGSVRIQVLAINIFILLIISEINKKLISPKPVIELQEKKLLINQVKIVINVLAYIACFSFAEFWSFNSKVYTHKKIFDFFVLTRISLFVNSLILNETKSNCAYSVVIFFILLFFLLNFRFLFFRRLFFSSADQFAEKNIQH